MRILFIPIALVFLISSVPASGMTICWVEEIVRLDDAMSVRMMKNYKHTVNNIRRKDGTTERPFEKEDDSFKLREGDQVSISMSHDTCTAAGVMRNGIFGVELHVTSCMPGMPCLTAQEFVTAE